MSGDHSLPSGQKEIDHFPRFGLPQYANRFPENLESIHITIGGDIEEFTIAEQLSILPRVKQTSDFHCVTTWSKVGLNWSGYRFSEFYNNFIKPKVKKTITHVIFKAQDGYKTSLPLEDLMQDNVLLADQLDDQSLGIEHGAPMRIIAPNHYGSKNLKHIKRLEFYSEQQQVKQGILGFMDHPRARVAYEERALNGPGRFFRWLYKFGINKTMKDFERATDAYKSKLKN